MVNEKVYILFGQEACSQFNNGDSITYDYELQVFNSNDYKNLTEMVSSIIAVMSGYMDALVINEDDYNKIKAAEDSTDFVESVETEYY